MRGARMASQGLGGVVEVIIYGYLEKPGWIGVSSKQFWDYLDLLIVPAAIAIGVTVFNWMQSARQSRDEDAQQKLQLEVENQRAQDAALQAYLDQMSQLLLDKDPPLRQSDKDSEVRTLARARTLTVLSSLDGDRKAQVVQFLFEAGLIAEGRPIVDLDGANLRRAVLREVIMLR